MLRRERIGFIFQAFNLLPTLTAEENIRCRCEIAGRKPDPAWFDRVVDTVGLRDRLEPPARPSCPAGSSSGSPCARALISRPEVIFADEPTGNLDSPLGAEVLGSCASAVDELGQTIVMVTHDPTAAAYADRVRVPRRRPDRRRDARADRRLGARPDEDPRRRPSAGGCMMLRATLKGLLARKLRLTLSGAGGRARRRVRRRHVRAHRHDGQRPSTTCSPT